MEGDHHDSPNTSLPAPAKSAEQALRGVARDGFGASAEGTPAGARLKFGSKPPSPPGIVRSDHSGAGK